MTEANWHSLCAPIFFLIWKIAYRAALNHRDVQTLKTTHSNLSLGYKTNNLIKIPDNMLFQAEMNKISHVKE